MPYANNKAADQHAQGADQHAHPRSLISAFFVRCLDSIIHLVSTSEISGLYLASVAAQADLSITWSQTTKTGFLVTWLSSCISSGAIIIEPHVYVLVYNGCGDGVGIGLHILCLFKLRLFS